jgi:DNA-directed RNA polymerase specialized sigma24 family protein
MIDYINARLNMWARWRSGGRFSSRSPYPIYNLPRTRDADDAPPRLSFIPIKEEECWHVDKCVVALPPDLRDLIEVFYLWVMPMEQKCRQLGCCEATVYNRLQRAHQEIMGYLLDIDAGVQVLAWTQKSGQVARALNSA